MVNDIIEAVRAGLTGDNKADAVYLAEQAEKYAAHENAVEILQAISEMTFALLSDDQKERLKEVMFIGSKRIDQHYNEAVKAANEGKLKDAAEILSKIEEHAEKHFSSTEESNRFSFRNPFEEYLYVHMYKPTKRHERTPFDFSKMLSFYGYILVELRKPQEAVPVLEKAIRFNPVNPEPRYELAEAFKLLLEDEQLLECVKDTLKIANTPYAIARCYCNLGFYAINVKDYDSAVAFYYESLLYAENVNVAGELQHISALTGKKVAPPTRAEVLAAFEKYDIPNGPNQDVVNIAYSLGKYCIDNGGSPNEAMFYLNMVHDLTNDLEVKDMMDKLREKMQADQAAQEDK